MVLIETDGSNATRAPTRRSSSLLNSTSSTSTLRSVRKTVWWLLCFLCLVVFQWNREFLVVDTHPTHSKRSGLVSTHSNVTTSQTISVEMQNSISFPVSNVLLLGQFNYDISSDIVLDWVRIWSPYFQNILPVGPLSNETQHALQEAGQEFRVGDDDRGYYSPVINLQRALTEYADGMDAVLYVHDDALLNLQQVLGALQRSSYTTIVTSFKPLQETLYHSYFFNILRPTTASENPDSIEFYWELWNRTNEPFQSSYRMEEFLPVWGHYKRCLPRQQRMILSPNLTSILQDYAETQSVSITESSSVIRQRYFFPSYQQSDFLLVPTRYAERFQQLAMAHTQSRVFLECAMPAIVFWMTMEHYALQDKDKTTDDGRNRMDAMEYLSIGPKPTIERIRLCTDWLGRGVKARHTQRGQYQLMSKCLESQGTPNEYGMYHPIKLNVVGSIRYKQWMNQINKPTVP